MLAALAERRERHLAVVRRVEHRRGVVHAEGAERGGLRPGLHVEVRGVPEEQLFLLSDDLDAREYLLHLFAHGLPVLHLDAEARREAMAAPRVEKRRKLLEHADRVSACRHAQRAAHYAAADGGGERDGRVPVAAYAARDAAEDSDRPVIARQHISEFIVGKLVDLFEYFRGKLAPLAVQRDELADLSSEVLAREEHFDREVGEV